MYLPFIVFFYMGKELNSQFWKSCAWGFLAVFAIILALYKTCVDENWFMVLAIMYWISGIVLTFIAWNHFKKG